MAEPDLPNPNPSGQDLSPAQSVPIDRASLASHYELDDVNIRAIIWFGVAIFVATTVISLLLWWLLSVWTGGPLSLQMQIAPANPPRSAVPGVGLEAAPEVQLAAMLKIQTERLNSYGWIDRDAGIVHIPIERAMMLFVEEGVPAADGAAPDFGLAPAFRMDSSGGVVPAGSGTAADE